MFSKLIYQNLTFSITVVECLSEEIDVVDPLLGLREKIL